MKKIIISLSCIMLVSLIIKLIIMPSDFPGDGLIYYNYAQNTINGNYAQVLKNIGFPIFLMPFISLFPYHQTQIIFSIISSIILIPISFVFFSRYFGTKLSIIAAVMMNFDYRIIENSVMGITEPLMMVFGVSSLVVKNKKIAFLFAGIAAMIRTEAFVFIIYLAIKEKKPHYVPLSLIPIFLAILFDPRIIEEHLRILSFIPHGNLLNSLAQFTWIFIPFILCPFGFMKKPGLLFPFLLFALPGVISYTYFSDLRYFIISYPFMTVVSIYGIIFIKDMIQKARGKLENKT